jgi:hypothetical protein
MDSKNQAKYCVGEVLDVTFHNVKVTEEVADNDGGTKCFAFADPHLGATRYVTPEAGHATIVRKVPADGIPQVGDVWQDRYDIQWFAAAHYPDVDGPMDELARTNKDGWYLVLVPVQLGEAGSPCRPEEVIDRYGPIRRLFRPSATVFTEDTQEA